MVRRKPMKNILAPILFFVSTLLFTSPSQGQIYTYNRALGCSCYTGGDGTQPGINLRECQTALNWAGLEGVLVQIYNPRPPNGCGPRFIPFSDTFFGVQFRHCCN